VQGDKLRGFHICLDKIPEDVVAMQKDGFPLMLSLLETALEVCDEVGKPVSAG
jgi:hypothetical protein